MAYSIKNLMCVANNKSSVNGAGIPNKWMFYNADSDTVTTADFISYYEGVKEGDQIEVVSADYTANVKYYASVTAKVITLVASDVPVMALTDLTDTPATLVGAASDTLKVNAGETAVEFVTV